MNATRMTIDLTAYELTDKQVAELRRLFHFLMQRVKDKTRGNVMISLDGKGNIGEMVKTESFAHIAENSNGAS